MNSIAFALVGLCLVGCGAAPDANGTNEGALEHAASAPVKTSANEIALPAAMRCVDLGRYETKGAAVVDTAAGNVWQRTVDPVTRTQPEAAAYCKGLNVDGRTGWRLPSVAELGTIRFKPALIEGGADTCSPSIDQSAFPNTPASLFWTSTVRPLGDAYYTNFADGRSHGSQLDEPMFVRCVNDVAQVSQALAVEPSGGRDQGLRYACQRERLG